MVRVVEKKIEFEVVSGGDGVTEIIEVKIDDVVAVEAGGVVDVKIGNVVAVLRAFGKSFRKRMLDTRNRCESNNKSTANTKVSVETILLVTNNNNNDK